MLIVYKISMGQPARSKKFNYSLHVACYSRGATLDDFSGHFFVFLRLLFFALLLLCVT